MNPDHLAQNPVSGLPNATGISLKPQHYHAALDDQGHVMPRWIEVHPQNYFGAPASWGGGPPHRWLGAIAGKYPISFHSTGLSLGSADGLNEYDLDRLAILCDRYNPASVSDHLSFSGNAHNRFADLLPVPYTLASLNHFAAQIDKVQSRLKRKILIENPSCYLAYAGNDMSELEFIAQLITKTGCSIIFDINNLEVSSTNLNFSAEDYIDAVDPNWVGEIHLAGHAREDHDSGPLLIDDHGSAVTDYTWQLFKRFIARSGPKPVLIEWDTNVPEFDTLMTEAAKAEAVMGMAKEQTYAAAC
jgi:uncharacterized protein